MTHMSKVFLPGQGSPNHSERSSRDSRVTPTAVRLRRLAPDTTGRMIQDGRRTTGPIAELGDGSSDELRPGHALPGRPGPMSRHWTRAEQLSKGQQFLKREPRYWPTHLG